MGETMSAEAVEARRAYQREYRRRNQAKINSQRKNWRAENQDKIQQYNREYWERRAEKARNIRASWEDYGITPERLDELLMIVRSGEYDDLVLSAARMADKKVAEHILKSIIENKSYDALRAKWELQEMERVPYGRTDFYGMRRLFFHYLDCALKGEGIGGSKNEERGI